MPNEFLHFKDSKITLSYSVNIHYIDVGGEG